MRFGDLGCIVIAQYRFQHNADGDRQARYFCDTGAFKLRQRIIDAALAVAQLKFSAGIE